MSGPTIDKRVVEMAFENGQFEKGIQGSLKSIDNLKKGLNFEGATKGLDGISKSANNVDLSPISKSLDGIKNRFDLMGIVGMSVIFNLTNSAIDLAKKLANVLLGVDNIKAGFGGYETKINAIRTVMSGTGEDLASVTQSLDELNNYSDRTIYSFEDMTANISKFTNAGLSSKQAAIAIQGISNVAAMAGANTNEASRAMYNFGQALQQGSVRLMDWKSIENANMATIGFKTELLEKAAALGVLRKELDGTYTTLKEGTNISATKGFNESLQEQWLNVDVLNQTLADYASLETEIGKKANAAATEIKTWTQLMATMADSMKTGWTKSFGYLFGDLNEATKLFTYFGDIISVTMGNMAASRNELLKGWHDAGGRDMMVQALESAINNIGNAIKPVVEAFKEIFPPMTVERLLQMTKSFTDLVKQFQIGEGVASQIKRIFKGIFAIFDIGKSIVMALIDQVGKLFGSFSVDGSGILEFFAKIGDKILKFRDSAKSLDTITTVFENIFKVITPVVRGIVGFFAALIGGLASLRGPDTSHATDFLEALAEKAKEFGKIGDVISKILTLIQKFSDKVSPIIKKIGSLIGEAFNKFLDWATKALDNFDVDKVLNFFNKGLFAGVLLAITNFIKNSEKAVGTGIFASILLSIKNFIDNGGSIAANAAGILDKVKDTLTTYQKSIQANTLMTIAKAVGLLALSIIALAFVPSDKLLQATGAIAGLLYGLMTAMSVMDKVTLDKTKVIGITIAIGALAGALLVFSGAVLILGNMKQEKLVQGVLAVTTLLTALTLFIKFVDTSKGLLVLSVGLGAIAVSMLVLSLALKSLGDMDTDQLAKGLVAMGVSLGIFALTLSSIPPTIGFQALGIAVLAGSLLILSKALKDMGGMSWEEIGRGLTTLGISLGILVIALSAMTGAIAGSAALLVASLAIGVLAVSLVAISKIPLEGIGIALLGIAGVFTVIGLAGAVLTPVVPTLLGLGAAMLLIGIAALGIGVGLLAFSAGLGALAVSGAAGAAALGGVIAVIATLLPMIAQKLLTAIFGVIDIVVKSAPKIIEGLVTLFNIILDSITEIAPKLIDTGLTLLDNFLTALDEKLPSIVEHGYGILMAFLSGIRDNIEPITTTAIEIVTNFVNGLASGIPLLAQTAWNFIISWIDGIAVAAETNIPALMDAVRNLGLSVVKGIVTGWTEGAVDLVSGIGELVNTIVNTFKEKMGIHSPSTVFVDLAGYIIEGLVFGIQKTIYTVINTITELANKIVSGLTDKYNSMSAAGRDLVSGFADGISGQIKMAVDRAGELARAVLQSIRNVLDMHSPSRVLTNMGSLAGSSFGDGIGDSVVGVVRSTTDLSNKVISSFSQIASKVADTLNTDMNFSPSIRPVFDLTDIKNGGSKIQGILDGAGVTIGLATQTATSIARNNIIESDPTTSKIDTKLAPSTTFNQYNYSPKELSRIEIYRQTRNQLAQLGGIK